MINESNMLRFFDLKFNSFTLLDKKTFLIYNFRMLKIIFCLLISFSSIAKVAMPNSDYTYALMDLSNNKIVSKQNEDNPMTLASVSKLFTMHYALSILGVDYKFRTRIYFDGDIDNGIAKGKLYLIGSGDPYLTAPNVVSLIQQLKNKGIRKLDGEFIYDDSHLSFVKKISTIGLEDQPDNPSMGALNIEFNRFKVWGRGEEVHPPLKFIALESRDMSSNGLKFNFLNNNGLETWLVNKKEKINYIEDLPTRDSSVFTAEYFRLLGERLGVDLPKAKRGIWQNNGKLFAEHSGLPLNRLAYLCLEYSNNLIAETLLKSAVKEDKNQIVGSEKASELMHKWLQESFNDIDWKKSSFINGSGLTINNKVSANTMVQYLQKLSDHQYNTHSFFSLLSINAHSGGLARRLRHPSYAYRVFGKTGSLHYVSNLAGYLIANSGKRYAFAIFMTDKDKREKLNGKNSKENNVLRNESKPWYSSSILEQDELLKEWIQRY